jgi:hypothetical protein
VTVPSSLTSMMIPFLGEVPALSGMNGDQSHDQSSGGNSTTFYK